MSARKWHVGISIVLLIPLFIVGATAVFIAHDHALGTEHVEIDARWLPGMKHTHEQTEIRDWLLGSSRGDLVATKYGVFRLGETPQPLAGLPKAEFRQLLVDGDDNLWAAGKMGVWIQDTQGNTRKVKDGDFHAIERAGDVISVFEKASGVWVSSDQGTRWHQDHPLAAGIVALPVEYKRYTLKNLIMDMHTGKAFLGKSAEWIWIDVLGLAMVLLSITGAVVWWRNRKVNAVV